MMFYINGFPKFSHETEQNLTNDQNHVLSWYEEVTDNDLKWSFAVNRFVVIFGFTIHYSLRSVIFNNFSFLFPLITPERSTMVPLEYQLIYGFYLLSIVCSIKGISNYQEIAILDTKPFGKVCKLLLLFLLLLWIYKILYLFFLVIVFRRRKEREKF